MRTFFGTLGVLAFMAVLLAPIIILAKDEINAKTSKADRRVERDGNKLVEKIKDKERSKGTNSVYRTGRTFPLMFSRPERKAPTADKRK